MKSMLFALLVAAAATATTAAPAQTSSTTVEHLPEAGVIAKYLIDHGPEDPSGNFTFKKGTYESYPNPRIGHLAFKYVTANHSSGEIEILLRPDGADAARILNGGGDGGSAFLQFAAYFTGEPMMTGEKTDADGNRYLWASRAQSHQQWEFVLVGLRWQNADIMVELQNPRADLFFTTGEQPALEESFDQALGAAQLARSALISAYVVAPIEDLRRQFGKLFGGN